MYSRVNTYIIWLYRHGIYPRVGFCVAPFRQDGQCETPKAVGRATGTATRAFFVSCTISIFDNLYLLNLVLFGAVGKAQTQTNYEKVLFLRAVPVHGDGNECITFVLR